MSMLINPYLFGAGVVTPAVTWNPLDKHAAIVLTNSDLSFNTSSAGWVSVRSTTSKSTGLWYYEVKFDVGVNYSDYGFGNAAALLYSYPGFNNDSVGYVNNGELFRNGSLGVLATAFVSNDIACFALDLTNRKFWVRRNNAAWNAAQGGTQDPASNQGGQALGTGMLTGAVFCMGGTTNTNTRQTGRWKTADFSYSPPAGFSPWQ